MIIINLPYIAAGLLVVVVVLYFTWPAFRQVLRLCLDMHRQLGNVAAARAKVTQSMVEVREAEAASLRHISQYKTAVQGNASEDVRNAITGMVARAKRAVSDANNAAAEAGTSLQLAVEALDRVRESWRRTSLFHFG